MVHHYMEDHPDYERKSSSRDRGSEQHKPEKRARESLDERGRKAPFKFERKELEEYERKALDEHERKGRHMPYSAHHRMLGFKISVDPNKPTRMSATAYNIFRRNVLDIGDEWSVDNVLCRQVSCDACKRLCWVHVIAATDLSSANSKPECSSSSYLVTALT
jgi:hypothetical protein